MLQDEQPKKTKPKGLRRELSAFGGARSLIGQAKMGGNVIGSGFREITKATKKTLEPGRFESFDTAMSRLGVSFEELPIIHNQLVLQVYLTFFVGCIALTSSVNLVVQQVYVAALVALLVACAAFTKMGQSSVQCYFIRKRQLGISSQWWINASEWFPNRMQGFVTMAQNDPLREPRAVNAMARNARRHFLFSAIVCFPGVLSFVAFGSMGWPLVSFSAAAIFVLLGSSLSFEVYKRREAVVCDLYPWLSSPEFWIPKVIVAAGASVTQSPLNTKAL